MTGLKRPFMDPAMPAPLRRLIPIRRARPLLALFVASLAAALAVSASPAADVRLGPETGLPVPRFVSLKFAAVNGREGPSFEHPVVWRYMRRGLPMEIIEEDLDWRKVRDPDGDVVWMHRRVLDNRRTGLVTGAPAQVLRRPDPDAPVAAIAEPGVLFEIKDCRDGWLRVDGARATGWMRDGALWGAGCG